MRIHNPAAIEVGLEEMHYTQLGACGDVHQRFFRLDFGVSAMLVSFQSPRFVKLGMQLLQASFSESIEFIIVFFQGCDEGILVGVVIPGRSVDN
jgi:hypothetical protein